ncbi:hypothetical protein D3C72_2048350 [compost metagenome]
MGSVGVFEQHDEFLTTPTTDNIRLAQAVFQYMGELAQHFVAGQMAMGIVELLEVIQVDQ